MRSSAVLILETIVGCSIEGTGVEDMWHSPQGAENYMFRISQEETPGVFHK